MTLESLNGRGVLYGDAGDIRVAESKYQIVHTLPVGRDPESWHGTFTTPLEITDHEDYHVQLDDLRHGPCELSMGTRAMSGIPAVFHYSFKGAVLALPGTPWDRPIDKSGDEPQEQPLNTAWDETDDAAE